MAGEGEGGRAIGQRSLEKNLEERFADSCGAAAFLGGGCDARNGGIVISGRAVGKKASIAATACNLFLIDYQYNIK